MYHSCQPPATDAGGGCFFFLSSFPFLFFFFSLPNSRDRKSQVATTHSDASPQSTPFFILCCDKCLLLPLLLPLLLLLLLPPLLLTEDSPCICVMLKRLPFTLGFVSKNQFPLKATLDNHLLHLRRSTAARLRVALAPPALSTWCRRCLTPTPRPTIFFFLSVEETEAQT